MDARLAAFEADGDVGGDATSVLDEIADGSSRARSGIVPIVARPSHVQHDPFVADSRLSPSPPANAKTLTLPSSFQLEEKRPSRGTPPWPD